METTSILENKQTKGHSSKILEGKLPCPDIEGCGSSDAYHTYDDGHGYCYSCNQCFNGNGYDLTKKYSYEYLPHWNISENTFRFYGVKTKIDEEGLPVSVGFVYPNKAIQVRKLNQKEFYVQKGPNGEEIGQAGLFGRDKFTAGSSRSVTITEGAKDALSLYEVLRSPVVAVQSASSGYRDCVVDRSWLNSFERVYLALDSDQRGREATAQIAKLFDYNKIYHVRYDKKDANEYLASGERDTLKTIWWNAKKYLPETIVSSFDDFEKILKEPPVQGVPYPFSKLNEMTYGIRPSESVLITAQEGVGKTELMHAIEYQLLKETDDAIGAIFLEEPKRRHLLAVAGCELQRPVHVPGYDASNDEIFSAVQKAVGRDDRLHLYSHFGSDDPDIILDTIRFLVSSCGCKYVLLDHITMVVSGLAGEDERRALDYFATRLEMMVNELNFALIMVSHVNDLGQTRGSRMISKVANIRIDMVRDISHPDQSIKSTTYLTVSKNRFCWKTGPADILVFDHEHNKFVEKEGLLSLPKETVQ